MLTSQSACMTGFGRGVKNLLTRYIIIGLSKPFPPYDLACTSLQICFVPVRCPQQRYVVMVVTVGRKNLFREHY